VSIKCGKIQQVVEKLNAKTALHPITTQFLIIFRGYGVESGVEKCSIVVVICNTIVSKQLSL